MKVELVEPDELDQGDPGIESEGDGPSVGGMEVPFQVHLRDLPRQVLFQLDPSGCPPGPGLFVGMLIERWGQRKCFLGTLAS